MSDETPRVTRLSVTPIKGLGLHHPDEISIDRTGAAGDRDFFLVDDRGKLLSVTRSGSFVGLRAAYDPRANRLELRADGDGVAEDEVRLGEALTTDFWGRPVPGHVVEGPWSDLLSGLAGRPLRLVKTDEPGAGSDEEPVSLLGEASVAELARRSGLESVDARRFRMLIEFSGTEPHAEDTWKGRTVEVGGARLRVAGPVGRCAATTRHPDRGDRDLQTVKLIRDYRGIQDGNVNFGVYATVVSEGKVRVGDPLIVQPAP